MFIFYHNAFALTKLVSRAIIQVARLGYPHPSRCTRGLRVVFLDCEDLIILAVAHLHPRKERLSHETS